MRSLVAACVLSTSAIAQLTIPNGDFESGKLEPHWSVTGNLGNCQVVIETRDLFRLSKPSKVLRVTLPPNSSVQIVHDTPLQLKTGWYLCEVDLDNTIAESPSNPRTRWSLANGTRSVLVGEFWNHWTFNYYELSYRALYGLRFQGRPGVTTGAWRPVLFIKNATAYEHEVLIDNLTIRQGRGAWIAAKAEVWNFEQQSGASIYGKAESDDTANQTAFIAAFASGIKLSQGIRLPPFSGEWMLDPGSAVLIGLSAPTEVLSFTIKRSGGTELLGVPLYLQTMQLDFANERYVFGNEVERYFQYVYTRYR